MVATVTFRNFVPLWYLDTVSRPSICEVTTVISSIPDIYCILGIVWIALIPVIHAKRRQTMTTVTPAIATSGDARQHDETHHSTVPATRTSPCSQTIMVTLATIIEKRCVVTVDTYHDTCEKQPTTGDKHMTNAERRAFYPKQAVSAQEDARTFHCNAVWYMGHRYLLGQQVRWDRTMTNAEKYAKCIKQAIGYQNFARAYHMIAVEHMDNISRFPKADAATREALLRGAAHYQRLAAQAHEGLQYWMRVAQHLVKM